MRNREHLESPSALPPGRAAAWYTEVPANLPQRELAAYEALLDPGEQQRYRAFHFPEDRQLYLTAHALLRSSLSRYADVLPGDWRFEVQEHGRPELTARQASVAPLRFNLSHTRGLATCVIARQADVGIDAERLDRRVDATMIARRYFAEYETRQLEALPPPHRQRRFLEYWTLKEAYVKACGGGLSIPLKSFYFQRDRDGQWQITFDSNCDASTAWQFTCMYPTTDHVLSIAIRRRHRIAYEIDIRDTTPSTSALIN